MASGRVMVQAAVITAPVDSPIGGTTLLITDVCPDEHTAWCRNVCVHLLITQVVAHVVSLNEGCDTVGQHLTHADCELGHRRIFYEICSARAPVRLATEEKGPVGELVVVDPVADMGHPRCQRR